MNGLMMQQPLLISSLIVHAERHHGEQQIVSRRVEGDIHRCTYKELAARSRRMAQALGTLGVKPGQAVATLAWNGYRHLELYYGVSGSGAVLHTLNPRLHPDQVVYIADHAEDQVLFFDMTFLPLVEAVASRLKTVKHFVAMTDRAHMPANTKIANLLCYEELVARRTTASTGRSSTRTPPARCATPRAPPATRRACCTPTARRCCTPMAAALPDALNFSARDDAAGGADVPRQRLGPALLACMVGAKLVFPGAGLDGKSLYELFEAEKVTLSAGVPTVWLGLLAHVEANKLKFSTMQRTVIGGSACPPAMIKTFQESYGVDVLHAWGMTEMSPLGTVCKLQGQASGADAGRAATRCMAKQGRAIFGVEMKIVDDDGKELPWDGKAFGELLVRGPWILPQYFKGEGGNPLVDGWFPTGDVATIDADGYMQITDRTKDVIKSGGEWISSIDLENIAMAHPAVAEAACIAVFHPKWDERPLLMVVKKPGAELTREQMLEFFDGKIAKWWMPDDVVFVDAIPLGATGKLQKTKLREMFKDHKLPTA